MRRIIIVISNLVWVLATSFSLRAQTVTRSELLHELAGRYSVQRNVAGVTCIVNGNPYTFTDSIKLDSVLSSYLRQHLISIEVLHCESAAALPCNPDVVIMRFATKQDLATNAQQLNIAKARFKDKYSSNSEGIISQSKDPVLYIDGTAVGHTKAKSAIRNLSADQLYSILNDTNPGILEIHGQNAKNGLVLIWLSTK